MNSTSRGEVIWRPGIDALDATKMGRFAQRHGFIDYRSLQAWSVNDLPGFWHAVTTDLGVRWRRPGTATLASPTSDISSATWFPGTTLNYAEQALTHARLTPDAPAIIARSQTRPDETITWQQLHDRVARCAATLRTRGVGPGDRVAAYMPNIPETVVAFLAAASLGAIWASCAPEFGARGVLDRLTQIRPKVLLTVDGYLYGDRLIDRRAVTEELIAALPSLDHVRLGYLGTGIDDWSTIDQSPLSPLTFEAVPFAHPLYILFSSGTTGAPKPIVHSHGGITVEHMKALMLHHDLGPGERFFWFSTTGWMMWNYLVSGLLTGASIVAFDGDPAYGGLDHLWRVAAETEATVFGTSAPYITSCAKAGTTVPAGRHLRQVGSTGAPLPAASASWLHHQLRTDVQINSISGGTDVCTAFVGANPLSEVRAGEIAGPMLGCAVAGYSTAGSRCAPGELGELVITAPMPSMPVGFWDDPEQRRYRGAYFERFPGVWAHGDWVTFFEDGSCEITGRSDATLNRAGVRLGTADFYAVVESLPDVRDSLIVHLDEGDRLVLFVNLHEGHRLDDELRTRISALLRSQLSPRHSPDVVVEAPPLPRTMSGKKLEVPVRRILNGAPAGDPASLDTITNPETLDWFRRWRAD